MNQKTTIALQLLFIVFINCGFNVPLSAQLGSGWIALIDGETGLENWERVGEANWQAVDGAIQADSKTGEAAGFLLTKNAYSDFRLRVEFWVSEDADSGVFLRCSNPDEITHTTCYEANIFDRSPEPLYGTGAIVNIFPISIMPKAGGRWNVYEVTVQGPRLILMLNGEKTADTKDIQYSGGPIGLQYGAGLVRFRKVEVKPL